MTITRGQTYTDAGATASDDVDGDITENIIKDNPVNTNQVGSYTITYNVTDSSDNPAEQIERIVNVVAGEHITSSGSSPCASNPNGLGCKPAQNTTPTPTVPTSGCSAGALFNTTTGEPCGTTALPQKYTFTKTLKYGTTDIEVRYLQIVLNQDKDTQVAIIGNGSSGKETVYFRNLTLSAVKRFQNKYQLAVDGIVGPITGGKLMEVQRWK